ncbi:MAG: cation diffusion facilitator family transporter [Lachnospiraceae bacterium]
MENEFEKTAVRVSLVSIIVNTLLSGGKLLAGIFASSGAMISDAIHSASDVFSSIVVMIGVKISGKQPDNEHPYGHERMECVAAIILATILAATGLGIGYSAFMTIISGDYESITTPGIAALIAAIVSIIVKEAMFWYTRINAQKIDSPALMADAWHHRSDSLSSIGALIGIAGARLGIAVLDPFASFIICFFIEKAAYDIFMDAINKMVDHACDKDTENALKACAMAQPGVEGVDLIQTRIFGNKIYVDLEICADGNLSLTEAHNIAEQVHDSIEREFPKVKHIMVHVNPL